MTVSYTLTDSDTFATIYDSGRIVGTLMRPDVYRIHRPQWTVAARDGTVVLRRNFRPTRIAIERALRSHVNPGQ